MRKSTDISSQIHKSERTSVMSLACKIIQSPVGKLKLVASEKGLVAVLWEKDSPRRVPLSELVADDRHPVLVATERQLGEYFAGKRKAFSVALDLRGASFRRTYGQRCSTSRMERPEVMDSSRGARQSSGDTSCRCRERKESDIDHSTLPSRDWIVRETYRLRRWTRDQSAAANPGEIDVSLFWRDVIQSAVLSFRMFD